MSDPEIDARLQAASPAERRRAIIDARNAGYTLRQIAELVGLSVGGVHKIINQTKGATQ